MPGVGGLSIANNLLSNQIQLNLNKNQLSLQKVTAELSSGLRINGPGDDPSGFSIAANLQTQVQSFDQASRNVQDANNALTVASGALSTTTDMLQLIRTLAVQASSNLLSPSDRTNVQTEITQLISEVNSIANNTQFNGLSLVDGSKSGFQAAVNANVVVTQNSSLNSQIGNLVSAVSVSVTNTATVDGSLEFQVVQATLGGASTIATNVFYISSAGLVGSLVSTIGNFGVAGVYAATGVTISLNSVATSDIGSTSFVKISQYVSSQNYATSSALSVQSSANEGDSISFNLQSATAAALRVSNLNVQAAASGFNTLASQDTIGQVDNALQVVLTQQANLGAIELRLRQELDNNNLSAVNLQAAESNIRDLNVAQASTEYTKNQLLISFGTSLLAQANSNAQTILALFR
jgi:flagellin